jgi:hypothetical protein
MGNGEVNAPPIVGPIRDISNAIENVDQFIFVLCKGKGNE